jgi:hypothetical protein
MQTTCFVDQHNLTMMMPQQQQHQPQQSLILVNGVKDLQPHSQQMLLLDVVPAVGQMHMNQGSINVVQGLSQAINVIQVPSLNQSQSNGHMNPSSFNLQLADALVMQNNPHVEIIELTDNGSFVLDQNQVPQTTLLCLSSQDPSATGNTFILSNGSNEVAFLGLTDPPQVLSGLEAVISNDGSLSPSQQSTLAKSWHYDADLVNRAMNALNRTSTTDTQSGNSLNFQDLCLTSTASL